MASLGYRHIGLMGKFVCTFRGNRDSYQVPLALAEAGLLDQFITDAYAVPWVKTLAKPGPQSVRAKVSFRSEPDLPVFTARYRHTPREILFQYHPHPQLESQIPIEDRARYPKVGGSSPVPQPTSGRRNSTWPSFREALRRRLAG